MRPFLWSVACVLGWVVSAPLAQEAATPESPWKIEHLTPESEIEWDEAGDSVIARNGVIVSHGDTRLTADRITFNRQTGVVAAQGQVLLESQGQLWRGEHLQYNFLTRQIEAENFRTGKAPVFAAGVGLHADVTNRVLRAAQSFLTTDDYAEPAYRIRARELTIVPGEYIEARGATLLLGSTPVFYYPYFRRSLRRHANFFTATPGYRSLYGPYLLSAYHFQLSEQIAGAVDLDYRVKRGFGGGPQLRYDLDRWGTGEFKYYYLHDEDPGYDPQDQPIREYRQRLSFFHQAELATNLTAKVVVQRQSDAQVTRDFMEAEYKENPQPSTFLEVNQAWSNFSLDLLAQPRLNPFYETIERLPDLRLTGLRQQIGASPLYYESDSSVGYFQHRYPDGVTNDFGALRADTYHQVLVPWVFGGWLNLTPRVGGRFTHYGEVDGEGSTLDEQNRTVFNTGAELTFKASRVWTGTRNRLLEVQGLRHIVQPSLNYVYVPTPSHAPPELPQFDRELPSLRLLPIDFPDYSAIDSIDSQNVLRLGLRNKLQTKRHDEVDTLLNWALYTDWRLKPRPDQSTFSDFYSDLDFRPRSWLTLNSEVRYDLDDNQWREANHTATLVPNDVWSFTLGHRYLRDDLASYGTGNNLIMSRIYYRFSPNWAVRLALHYEARDGVLEEQYYTLYRDLRSGTAALTFRVRDNRTGPTDFTVAFTLSLKALPRFKLNQDRDQPSLLLGS
jgi:lipopolysaccharide assembly outer membrane protein LptD (OstA)